MIQVYQVFSGREQFTLKNNGDRTCAVSYQGGFVMIGGYNHGKVDRWGEYNNLLFPIFLPDTTLKANTLTIGLYPTFLKQDILTPAPRSNLQTEKRSDLKKIPFSHSNRACWSPEVTMVDVSQAPSCTRRQPTSGQEEELFPGFYNKNLSIIIDRKLLLSTRGCPKKGTNRKKS